MFHSIHWGFCLLIGFPYTAAQPKDPTKWWLLPSPNDGLYLAEYQVKIQNENLFDVYTENQHGRHKWCTDPKIGKMATHSGYIYSKLRLQKYKWKGEGIFGRAPKYCNRWRNKARRPDGQCNDFDNPAAGSRFYRFGRNIPLTSIDRDECNIYHPNPRMISRKLLQRKEFIPATSVNMHIAGWIQFMTHDWFDHGTNDMRRQMEVKLAPDDPDFTGKTMKIPRTRSDSCSRFPSFFINACNSLPKKPKWCQGVKSFDTFQNTVTHWWDGSQLYGIDSKTLRKVRSYKDGKLKIEDNGRLPIDAETGLPITGSNNNWWAGLAMMHFLWTKEHNHVCDMLKQRNPEWKDEDLFQTTRLIITAVIAKIHTLEWTTAILNNGIAKLGLKSNWYGISLLEIAGGNATIAALLSQKYPQLVNGVAGAIGAPKNIHGVPFSLTEEFVAIYRFHPLLPDEIEIRDHETDTIENKYNMKDVVFSNTDVVFKENSMESLLYSFGNSHPGAMALHNYPKFLRNLPLPPSSKFGEGAIDLATIDLIRDRERGVPRYNELRRLIHVSPISKFEDLTPDKELAQELRVMYNDDVEQIDLLVGSLAEAPLPEGFGFSDTFFRIFVLMARRRLEADRFFTDDYTEEFYTKWGLEYIDETWMKDILSRHYPELTPHLENVENVFIPWKTQSTFTAKK